MSLALGSLKYRTSGVYISVKSKFNYALYAFLRTLNVCGLTEVVNLIFIDLSFSTTYKNTLNGVLRKITLTTCLRYFRSSFYKAIYFCSNV
jgi:hypothetical protein